MAIRPACAPQLFLPVDLVPLILDALPPRPRLLVASLVCKAWRRAALSSLRVLPSCKEKEGKLDAFTRYFLSFES